MKKRATIKDVAQLAGVGISVVSYVLNDTQGKTLPQKTKKKVLDAARTLNYVPNSVARSMRTKKTFFLGVVSLWHQNDPAFIDILDGIMTEAQNHNYSVAVLSIRQKCDNYDYINLFLKHQIDGIIFVSYAERIENYDEVRHINMMKEHGVPFIVVNGNTSEPDTSYVHIDYFSSGIMGTEYMISKNHKNIIFAMINKENLFSSQKVRAGYVSAMEMHNYSSKVSDISEIGDICRRIKANDMPCSAIVCSKCDVAYIVYEETFKYNIAIPDELSILACNYHNYAPYLHPPLTTVTTPLKNIGEKAVILLMNALEKEDDEENKASASEVIKLQGSLVERGSVKIKE